MTISTVSRRDFLRLSAGTVGALGAVSPPLTRAGESGRVALVIDPADREAATPPVAWAAEQLEAALAQHGIAVARVRSVAEVPAAATRCIVAATCGVPVARQTLRESRLAPPSSP